MSAVVAAPYEFQILRNHYPLQSAELWFAYAAELTAIVAQLRAQYPVQQDLVFSVGGMSGKWIDKAAQPQTAHRLETLWDSIHAYELTAREADAVARRISATKDALDSIVRDALNAINQATDEANKAKDQARSRPLTAGPEIAAIESKLRTDIQAIITAAQGQVEAVDKEAAGNTTASSLAPIQSWEPRAEESGKGSGAATPLSTGTGGAGTPAPLSPNNGVQAVDYNTVKDAGGAQSPVPDKKPETENTPLSKQAQQAAWNPDRAKDAATTPNSGVDKSPGHPSPPMSSAPSSGGSPASSGGSPSSMIGQMMPRSMSSAPSSPSSSSPAGAHAGGAGSPAGAGAPGGAGAAPGAASGVRGAGLAGAGSGIAESSARFASGAVNAGANTLGTAINLGSQVAQGAASAASAAATPAAAGTPPGAASGPVSGAPVGMVAAAGGSAVVSPVTGGPVVGGGPAATPPAGATPVSSVGGAMPHAAASSSLAPVPVQTTPGVRGVGADGATGDVLFTQAMDAGRDVITALLAQTKGYMAIDYAVSVMWERSGQVSAWLATSEGASYIPLGVRVPQDVALAITDPVVGRQLWDETAAAGGGDPLEVVVRQAQAREMAAPGARVLAIASSVKMDRVQDWAGEVKARPVSVNPNTVARDIELPPTRHRCQVAMPWEWQQAHAFSEETRHQIAARHVMMAAVEGHLHSPACEKVMDLFESRKPIDDALWPEVQKERFMALIEYQSAMSQAGHGGAADPARALATARAAEVVECLRTHTTAEGCADLLYATRLAGAPLSSGEAAV